MVSGDRGIRRVQALGRVSVICQTRETPVQAGALLGLTPRPHPARWGAARAGCRAAPSPARAPSAGSERVPHDHTGPAP
jgi:hypothetical protein